MENLAFGFFCRNLENDFLLVFLVGFRVYDKLVFCFAWVARFAEEIADGFSPCIPEPLVRCFMSDMSPVNLGFMAANCIVLPTHFRVRKNLVHKWAILLRTKRNWLQPLQISIIHGQLLIPDGSVVLILTM